MNEYILNCEARCPKDPTLTDHYRVTIRTGRLIPVENLLSAMEQVKPMVIYQEDLADHLAKELRAEVMLEGVHSCVTVRSTAGNA